MSMSSQSKILCKTFVDYQEISKYLDFYKSFSNQNKFSDEYLQEIKLILEQNKNASQKKIITRTSIKNQVAKKNFDKNLFMNELKEFIGFSKFLSYHSIDNDCLLTAIGSSKIMIFEANSYIFKQGEKSDYFYILLKGGVQIRYYSKNEKISNDSKEKLYFKNDLCGGRMKEIIEEKILNLSNGMCFGEWGILNNKQRNFTSFCLEKSFLLVLNKEWFDKTIGKNILKAESDRRVFLKSVFTFLSKITKTKFEELYKKIIPKIYNKDEIIFSENDHNDRFYLLYKGEGAYQKSLIFNESHRRSSVKTFLKISKGDIVGIEGFNKLNSIKYGYQFKATQDNTIIFEIQNHVFSEFSNIISHIFDEMNKQKSEIIENLVEKQEKQIKFRTKSYDFMRDDEMNRKDEELKIKLNHTRDKLKNSLKILSPNIQKNTEGILINLKKKFIEKRKSQSPKNIQLRKFPIKLKVVENHNKSRNESCLNQKIRKIWNKTVSSPQFNYNSGTFNLPLVSKLI